MFLDFQRATITCPSLKSEKCSNKRILNTVIEDFQNRYIYIFKKKENCGKVSAIYIGTIAKDINIKNNSFNFGS